MNKKTDLVIKVLFVCVENSCRSQIAEALFNREVVYPMKAYSAGSKPSGIVNPMAIEVLAEQGIDITHAKSKGFIDLPVEEFDYAVSLGCKDDCPFVPANQHIEWEIADPKYQDMDFFRRTRDELKENVYELIKQLEKYI